MSQAVGDLVVSLDVDAAKFKEQVEFARKQLGGLGDAAQKAEGQAVQSFTKQEIAARRADLSMGQYTNAVRMLPAQFTDVATQLAGGQSPWLILLQQGGQVKDSFGGVSNVAKILLTYITPLNAAIGAGAAVFGVLAISVYKSRQEIAEASKIINDSLGLSGDSASQLALNMRGISEASGESIKSVSELFITTKDGADVAIEKMISVGFTYQDAKDKVNEYKNSSNFTALNSDIENHKLKVLGIKAAWGEAEQGVKNYYTGVNSGKQSLALGGAIDPIVALMEQAKQLRGDLAKATIDGNLATQKNVEWITKEYLATDRVAGAEARLKESREISKKIAFSGDTVAISNAQKLITLREKEVEAAKKSQEPKKAKGVTVAPGDRASDTVNAETLALQTQLKVLQQHAGANETISQQRKNLWEAEAKFSVLDDAAKNRALSKDEQSLLANKNSVLAQAKINAKLGDQIVAQQDLTKLQEALRGREGKTLDLTKQRFDLLERLKAQGGISPAEYDKTSVDVANKSITAMPRDLQKTSKKGDALNGVSGTFGNDLNQLSKLDQQSTDLQNWYQSNLTALAEYRQQRSDLNAQWDAQELALRQKQSQAEQSLEQQKNSIIQNAVQSSLGSVVDITRTAFGEKSAIYKASFIADKAYAVAQSMLAIQTGIALAVANPFPANLVAMASVAAATASLVSNIQSIGLTGMAHSGIDAVPETGTWLLQKGERVMTSQTSAKLDATLENMQIQRAESPGGYNYSPTIQVNGDPDQRTLLLIESAVSRGAKQGYDLVTSHIASGRGNVSKALGSGWSTKRRTN